MMNMKTFNLSDLGAFMPNEFSNPDIILPALTHKKFEVQSLVTDGGDTMAVVAYTNYWGSCWSGFLLVAERFPFPAARTLRKHLHATMEAKKATRFQTDSVSNKPLRAWHTYLGFTLEGTRKKMMFDRDYDMWALLREGK